MEGAFASGILAMSAGMFSTFYHRNQAAQAVEREQAQEEKQVGLHTAIKPLIRPFTTG